MVYLRRVLDLLGQRREVEPSLGDTSRSQRMFIDLEFRVLFLMIFGIGLSLSRRLRNRADEIGGSMPRSADRPVTAWALRFMGVVFYGGLLIWLLYPPLLGWAGVSVPKAFRWSGVVLLAGGVSLALWSLWHLGRNVTPTAVARPDAELVTSGPYRWVRHPLYSSMLLTIPGCGLLTANLLVLGAGLATIAVILWRTRREEKELLSHFGPRYAKYQRRTGAILPRPRRDGGKAPPARPSKDESPTVESIDTREGDGS